MGAIYIGISGWRYEPWRGVFYPPGHYGPIVGPGYGRGDWMSYCFSRYRSFDPATGTYMGYDGRRHVCR